MDQISKNYAIILYERNISQVALSCMHQALTSTPKLQEVLESPVISFKVKQTIIKKVFPDELYAFLCVLCRHQNAKKLPDIFAYYQEYAKQKQGIVCATYSYVVMPDQTHVSAIKEFLKNRYQAKEIELRFEHDPKLLGGYVITVGTAEYDHSYLGMLTQLKQNITWR